MYNMHGFPLQFQTRSYMFTNLAAVSGFEELYLCTLHDFHELSSHVYIMSVY